jgi:pimeloyl-ACP methyl ester carboxylesterase
MNTPTTAQPATSAPTHAASRQFMVRGPDGELAVTTWGDARSPVVVLVHGYPDNSSKWEDVAQQLCADFCVVAYDVRGAGRSFTPQGGTRAYTLERLCADFQAVLTAVSPDRAVHLVAHDWGSIQAWEFATEPALAGRLLSYTTASGPCLDHVGHWVRDRLRRPTPGNLWQVAKQLLKSWYIYLFHLPWLPEAVWHGVLGRRWHHVLRLLESTNVPPRDGQARDGANGVGLYRANILPRLLGPRERHAHAPVQVLALMQDNYVNLALTEHLGRWAPELWRREVQGGHWLSLKSPALFAGLVREFVSHIEGAPASAALQQARVRAPKSH